MLSYESELEAWLLGTCKYGTVTLVDKSRQFWRPNFFRNIFVRMQRCKNVHVDAAETAVVAIININI